MDKATPDESATRTRFTGSLRDVSIGDLFQTLEMAAKTSEIEFDTDIGRAIVWFRDRAIIDAECGEARGADAIYRLAMADDGTFIARFRESARPPQIHKSPQFLLMEAARRRDEWLEAAGPRLRAATRLTVVPAALRGDALSPDRRALAERFDGDLQLIDAIPPGDDASARLPDVRGLVDAGVLEVLERPYRSTLGMQEGALDILATPAPEFWERAFVAYHLLDRTPRRAAIRVIAVNLLIISLILGLAWLDWRVLVGGQMIGWALLLVGHALGAHPQLVLRQPLLVAVEPLVIITDLLDRAGLSIAFVRRGRELAARHGR